MHSMFAVPNSRPVLLLSPARRKTQRGQNSRTPDANPQLFDMERGGWLIYMFFSRH
jgi:hypothetical protein